MTVTQATSFGEAPGSAVDRSFIEAQFPVSRLSKESYRERKAVAGQTLTALGKWWGRKPLVLVRACVLGLLLPATDDPVADREVFLALMTMDDDGLQRRFSGGLSPSKLHDRATASERSQYFTVESGRIAWRREIDRDGRRAFQRLIFGRMGYDEKLDHAVRPEQGPGPSSVGWDRINRHLGTNASTMPEFVAELGRRRFGHVPRVGDAFCGGGSIPFEAARIGCEAYGSDLSPVAALLTWGALNVVGGGETAVARVREAQERVFDAAKDQVDAWGIERNQQGWIADAYLYCAEVLDPATGWLVPLAPSWVIATKSNVIARLQPDLQRKRFDIEIVERVSGDEMARAAAEGTSRDGVRSPVDRHGTWIPPERRLSTGLEQLRGRPGLRRWDSHDIVPRPDDAYRERLYCIRWFDPRTGERHYSAPTAEDLGRERQVLALLEERFDHWQAKGYIPRRAIEPGKKTEELIRTRGWTHWHQLFNPRQLLINGLFASIAGEQTDEFEARALLLMVGRIADLNSRLSRWQTGQGGGIGGGKSVFYNQALNTLDNYSCRSVATLESAWSVPLRSNMIAGQGSSEVKDVRTVHWTADIWMTDPGYADAINYEELSEFFLAWYEQRLPKLFPGWPTDSRRALAVAGTGHTFRQSMVEAYRNLASCMADGGMQIVMFTHQNASVWADVALVLWAAGTQVTAAWTVATETEASGIKQGNYVQGTVLLVLRKRQGGRRGDLSDLYPDIQAEVEAQLREMLALDDRDEPNFSDADYQLAAYAAALRVITGYASIEEIDVEQELARDRPRGEKSPLVALIERAVQVASDHLVPDGLDRALWRRLAPEERLYVKGVEIEAHGEYREGVYQEFARGFRVSEYKGLLASGGANQTRLRTPVEFKSRDLHGAGAFAGSLLRDVLFAIYATHRDGDPRSGRTYLHQERPGYWDERTTIIALLRFLVSKPSPSMEHWQADVAAGELLLGALENDHA